MTDSPPSRVLILGGSGFLGGAVIKSALDSDLQVTSASRSAPRLGAFEMGYADHVDLDPTEESALARTLDELRPDSLVNCAALARGAACDADPGLAFRLNTELPGNLARLCREREIRLVHVSTDLVFDGEPPRDSGYRESDPADPTSYYGRSKLEGEERVLEENSSSLVARLPLLYDSMGSPNSPGAAGAILAMHRRGERPKLFTDEMRTPLDAREAGAALVELARGTAAGLLHVAGPRSISRFDLGVLVLGNVGVPEDQAIAFLCASTQAEFAADRPREAAARPRDVSLDSSLARSLLTCKLSPPEQRLLFR